MTDTNNVFNAYSRYYDLLYKDKDYESEVAYIREILTRHDIPSGDLLELGSGTGKHASLLVAYGYTVHGIERSAEMVAQAPTITGFSCQQADICSFNLGRTYDAVLSLFHVISYQITNQELNAVFANTASHLKNGGLFIFDVWYSPAVHAQRPQVRVKRMANINTQITRIAEPEIYSNDNRVDVNYTIYTHDLVTGDRETLQEKHTMRHLSLPEIDLLAGIHGFEMLEAKEFISGRLPSEETWGICITLKKRDPN